MLRILKKGKPVSTKEQEKMIKDNPNLVLTTGRPLKLDRAAYTPPSKYPGLRQPKKEAPNAQSKTQSSKK